VDKTESKDVKFIHVHELPKEISPANIPVLRI
jgi:hypothetical protein